MPGIPACTTAAFRTLPTERYSLPAPVSAVLAMLLSMVRKQLLPVLVVCALHSARASTNVDGAVAATLSEHGEVGLVAWSVEGRTGAVCMDGVAGVSVSGQSTPLVLE